jgi:O-antigen ligase
MTTSVSNEEIEVISVDTSPEVTRTRPDPTVYRIRHTLASRFLVLVICVAIVLSALAYGTVHYWALSIFSVGALTILCLWVVDAWSIGHLRISKNLLQLPLLGAVFLGIVQLLPLRPAVNSGLGISLSQSLSLDPNATRLVIVQLLSLLVYFAAVLVFVDTPRRLHLIVRTIMIFGFCLAMFGLTQSFTSPNKLYWIRELKQSTAFGPFINRHHFAGYMELTLALPLGLLFAGSVDREKKLLYLFLAGMMGVALFMTTSRGGVISLVAEVFFFVLVTAFWRKENERTKRRASRIRTAIVRLALGVALIVGLVIGVAVIGGGDIPLDRLVDSVNTNDPTTGRAHFWSVTLNMIKAHPVFGTGLGAFGVIYTGFDSHNGLLRLEQAHNDYLQVLSDGGIVGAFLAISFVAVLFARAFYRMRTRDRFRRGVALASLGGCLAVLVHSFFDFTLHTTANALLFLVLAALATLNGRVENAPPRRKRRRSTEIVEQEPVEHADLDDAVVKVI